MAVDQPILNRQMKINGFMIDCSRLVEKHQYYYRLTDFLSEWGYDTLFLHFTDDHGCSIRLKTLNERARKNAFDIDEIKDLISYAKAKGIRIVPEIETFGHTRYLTDDPAFGHLAVGANTEELKFNAIDPLNPATYELMEKLIEEVADIFPSKYLHIGCDEVNLNEYCRIHGIEDKDKLWADYVNKIILLARKYGKQPMLWGDHIEKNDKIAGLIDKNASIIYWKYDENVDDTPLKKFKELGFDEIYTAPSLACYKYRFLPTWISKANIEHMADFTVKYDLDGMITTVWCPYRYVQGALYYSIAYGSYILMNGCKSDINDFNRLFVEKVFGTELNENVRYFLENWDKLNINFKMAGILYGKNITLDEKYDSELRNINKIGGKIIDAAIGYVPEKNKDIWDDMLLAARCAWISSEAYMLKTIKSKDDSRIKRFDIAIDQIKEDISDSWDRGRYFDDPQKTKEMFQNDRDQYVNILINKLCIE